MSDTREKLIELLSVPIYPQLDADPAEVVADYLIANGVRLETETSDKTSDEKTSEWIPVSERLPDKEFWEHNTLYPDEDLEVAVMIKGAKRATALLYNAEGEFYAMDNGGETFYIVTHWMLLPEPPKGE